MVGHASQAANPGDYFTGSIADINYVIVRGDDGELRAFHNVRGLDLTLSCIHARDPRPSWTVAAHCGTLRQNFAECLTGICAHHHVWRRSARCSRGPRKDQAWLMCAGWCPDLPPQGSSSGRGQRMREDVRVHVPRLAVRWASTLYTESHRMLLMTSC
jgi:hypothetical protein